MKYWQHRQADAIFNLLHKDVAFKLDDHALHEQCQKLGVSLVGLSEETEPPFNPHRVWLAAYLSLMYSINLHEI